MARVRKIADYNLNREFFDRYGNLYSKGVAKSLRLWCRMTPSTPTDLGPNSLSPSYDNSPSTSTATFGNRVYSTLITNDVSDKAATVTSTTGLLSFSSANSCGLDRKSTRLNSSHMSESRMPSSA